MRYLLFFVLFTFSLQGYCCSCGVIPDFKSAKDLKDYQFIALVTIKKLAPQHPSRWANIRVNGDVTADVKELFKGKATPSFYDPMFRSDCALPLKVGEQWLFFGNIDSGRVVVQACSYNQLYRRANGEREWQYTTAIRNLDVLRKIFNHSSPQHQRRVFYPNGKLELSQHIKDGKLYGERKIYDPEGRLRIQEDFRNNIRYGTRKVYDTSGHVLQVSVYRNGKLTRSVRYQDTAEIAWYFKYQQSKSREPLFSDIKHDSAFFAFKLDSLRKSDKWQQAIELDVRYADDGLSYEHCFLDHYGQIKEYAYQDGINKIRESWYYSDGVLKSYTKEDGLRNKESFYNIMADGTRKDFERECTSCYIYFDKKNFLSAAEPVFVQ